MKAVTSNQQVPRATQSAECEQYVDGEYFCQKYFLYTSYLVVPSYMINKSHGALNKMWGKIMKKNICRPSLSCCIAFVESLDWYHSYYHWSFWRFPTEYHSYSCHSATCDECVFVFHKLIAILRNHLYVPLPWLIYKLGNDHLNSYVPDKACIRVYNT